jgi:hypothetical protein
MHLYGYFTSYVTFLTFRFFKFYLPAMLPASSPVLCYNTSTLLLSLKKRIWGFIVCFSFFKMGSYYVPQNGLEHLGSSNPPASAS